MTQHDYNIANQTMPSARADINNLFEAIATINTGENPPSSTFEHMLWADTTTNTLKQRNSSNTDWIILTKLNSNGGLIHYNGDPNGSITPDYAGQLLYNTSGQTLLLATGTNNTSWQFITQNDGTDFSTLSNSSNITSSIALDNNNNTVKYTENIRGDGSIGYTMPRIAYSNTYNNNDIVLIDGSLHSALHINISSGRTFYFDISSLSFNRDYYFAADADATVILDTTAGKKFITNNTSTYKINSGECVCVQRYASSLYIIKSAVSSPYSLVQSDVIVNQELNGLRRIVWKQLNITNGTETIPLPGAPYQNDNYFVQLTPISSSNTALEPIHILNTNQTNTSFQVHNPNGTVDGYIQVVGLTK